MAIHKELRALQPQLLAYARAICRSADAADDLVQDAIVRALEAAHPPVELEDLRPWMFRILRNLHLDSVRKLKVRAEYFTQQKRLIASAPLTERDPASSMFVRQVFESLSPDHREVLFLVDVMGMRYAEAAGIANVARGTIMSRLNRARRAMIDRLDGTNVADIRQHRSGTR